MGGGAARKDPLEIFVTDNKSGSVSRRNSSMILSNTVLGRNLMDIFNSVTKKGKNLQLANCNALCDPKVV